uniref:Uncharacterized protein n=1 Tax=Arundo donax TaxID=35708 RepID=A0A0A8ZYC5_ARUDO
MLHVFCAKTICQTILNGGIFLGNNIQMANTIGNQTDHDNCAGNTAFDLYLTKEPMIYM